MSARAPHILKSARLTALVALSSSGRTSCGRMTRSNSSERALFLDRFSARLSRSRSASFQAGA